MAKPKKQEINDSLCRNVSSGRLGRCACITGKDWLQLELILLKNHFFFLKSKLMGIRRGFHGEEVFDYNKTIKKHLETLKKYEEPHALEKHMKDLYKSYKINLFLTLISGVSGAIGPSDSYAFVFILFSAMCFVLAVKAWIEIQNLVMYRHLCERCVGTQNTEHSNDE